MQVLKKLWQSVSNRINKKKYQSKLKQELKKIELADYLIKTKIRDELYKVIGAKAYIIDFNYYIGIDFKLKRIEVI